MLRRDFNVERHAQVRELHQKAIEIDTEAQCGYIGVVHNYRVAANFGWLDLTKQEALGRGLEAAQKTL